MTKSLIWKDEEVIQSPYYISKSAKIFAIDLTRRNFEIRIRTLPLKLFHFFMIFLRKSKGIISADIQTGSDKILKKCKYLSNGVEYDHQIFCGSYLDSLSQNTLIWCYLHHLAWFYITSKNLVPLFSNSCSQSYHNLPS